MADKKPVYVSKLIIRWGDMDAFGHVNNAMYFKYIEQARFDWMESTGLTFPPEASPVIINAQCTFLKQLQYPADIHIPVYVTHIGRSSLDLTYEVIRDDDPDTVYATAATRVVWANLALGKSVPIPEEFKALLPELPETKTEK